MNFSVVIPLYNKAPHIKRTIDSVLAQTYQNFEIIVVNDGSTDNGPDIVSSYSDPRIRLINQVNQGVSVARNHGTKEAKFELVAFLDADDEWLPEFLRNIQVIVNNFPDCGAYATAGLTIKPNGSIYYPSLGNLPPEPWIGILPNFFQLIQEGLPIHSSSIVFPKHILLHVGGFPVGVKVSEDVYCWVNVALRYPMAINPKRLFIYHQDATNRHKDNLEQEPYIEIIIKAINDETISRKLKVEALEFVAQRQIIKAKANIFANNPCYANYLLNTCKKTKKYKNDWNWCRFLAFFPAGWPKKILTIKQRIFGE